MSNGGLALLGLGTLGVLFVVASGKKGERDATIPAVGGEGAKGDYPGGVPRPEAGSGDVKAALAKDLWGDTVASRLLPGLDEALGDDGDRATKISELLVFDRPLPEGARVDPQTWGAGTPLTSGLDRVTFDVVQSDVPGFTSLEGNYFGPSDPDTGPAKVVVDRVAHKGGLDLPLGRYTVPASSKTYLHDRLARVAWKAIEPKEAGFYGFDPLPSLVTGDKATMLVEDEFGTRAVALVVVRKIGETASDSADDRDRNLTVTLFGEPVRVVRDAGSGKVSFARLPFAQQTLVTTVSKLVNPKSLTPSTEVS